MKTIAIIGTGAVGGYCAIKLIQAGFEVHCLFGSDYAVVKQNGLTLISKSETVTLPVNAYQNVNEMPKCDVIIIALKSTQNVILKDMLPQLMNEKSVAVLLQNGIGVEDEIAQYTDPLKIIGATISLKVTKTSSGVIKHFAFSDIEFAQYYQDQKQSGITEKVKDLSEIFKSIGFNSAPMPHLLTIRWKKLIANIPTSGLSIILNASLKELVENSASYSLLISLTCEVIDVAKKCSAKIPFDYYQMRLKKFEQFKSMLDSNPSMKDDFDRKKPMELRAIYENSIRIARYNNIAMPLTEMLYQQLLYLDAKNL